MGQKHREDTKKTSQFSKNISSKLSNARFPETFGQIFIENDPDEYFQFLFFFCKKKQNPGKKMASFKKIFGFFSYIFNESY